MNEGNIKIRHSDHYLIEAEINWHLACSRETSNVDKIWKQEGTPQEK